MIKVLHLRDTNKICGPGKTILETACRIDRNRFDLSIGLFYLQSETVNSYADAAEARGIKIHKLRSKSQFSPGIISAITRVIEQHEIDILHSHDYKSDILTVLVKRRHNIPIITTAHGWITNSLKSRLYVWAGKQSFRYFDRVIAVSPKIQQEISRFGVSDRQLELVYNAIVAEDYRAENHESGYLRARFDIPKDHRIIGNIGRISPEKGQKDFILAAKSVSEAFRNVSFVLTGDGPDRGPAEELIRSLDLGNKVFLTGHLSNVKPVYKDIDILALTSYTEGFPNVLLEALCMDTPVLATDVGGVSSIITDRETGILVAPGAPEQIADGLKYLLSEPDAAKNLAHNGKQRVLEQFEFSQRVARIEHIYEQVIAEYSKKVFA